MTRDQAIDAIRSVVSLDDDQQLEQLQEAIEYFVDNPKLSTDAVRALFELIERFPHDDGYGMFWTALHLLEGTAGYESALVESVQRTPCEFTLGMVNALLNADIRSVNDDDLVELVAVVRQDEKNDDDVRRRAQRILEQHSA